MRDWFISRFSEDWQPFVTFITGVAHQTFFYSFGLIIAATVLGSLIALIFGITGASMARSSSPFLRVPGLLYINMVRGIPDVLFFIFFPFALDLGIKSVRTWVLCEPGTPLFNGINFAGCDASAFISSPNSTFAWIYYFGVACLALGIIFGSFAANVIRGAMDAVPKGQLETAHAYGFSERQIFWRIHLPQMWIYAWGGLTNIWILIIKATSLLSLLQIREAVWWARKIGARQPRESQGFVHDDWTVYYFLILMAFYLLATFASETGFSAAKRRLGRGMVTQ